MKKINKNINIALIFILIGVFSFSDISYGLRPPMISRTAKDYKKIVKEALTDREKEVLGLVAKGWEDKKIASKLNLGVAIVVTCKRNIRIHF